MSKLLEFISYPNLNNWSVAHLLENQFNYNQAYPLVKIGDFLKRNKTQIIVQDDIEYKRVTIKLNNGGIYLRDKKIGKEIGTKKQYLIKKGQFLLSKIDARNGAFGVVTEEVDQAIITGNFWTFDVDYSKINPHFLSLITTTKQFMKFAQSASSGTTGRHYLNEQRFLDVKIPLPPLAKQKEIVDAYQSKISLAEKQEKEAKEKEKEIEEYLYRKLGIEIDNYKNENLLNFINFSGTSRWDTSFLLDKNQIKSIYPLIPISNIINTFLKDLNHKSLRIDTKKYSNKSFKYIGMENIEKGTGRLFHLDEVKGEDIKSQSIRFPKGFFLYGKLRPYLNKYYYNKFDYDNIIVSSEFFVFSVKNINKEFFKYILSSSFIQFQIKNHMKGARMPRISEETFKNLKIPLPNIEIQTKIANHISHLKRQIEELKKQAQRNRTLALQEFETEIFNEA